MTRTSLLLVAAVALLGCTSNGKGPQTPAGATGPAGSTFPEPTSTGQFTSAANVKVAYPARVATAGAMTFVSDAAGNQVVGTGPAGTIVLGGLDKPLGIAVAGDRLYVGNAGRQDVEIYALGQQQYLRSLGGQGAFLMPNAIAVASDGTVAVADSKQNLVQLYSAAGAHLATLGGQGTDNGKFNFPSAVAIDDTRIVVGDQGNHRVQIFDRKGAFVAAFGSEVTGGKSRDDYKGKFTRIAGVALAGANIYVLDSAHAYVQVLDGAGNWQGFLGSSGDCASCMKLGLDVAVAADGSVLVTDPENRRVVTLSPELR
ncbi:MAG TPA: NHL repeat-containing protein [Mycobacterium sp.]|nr:NHL repeat-containing protein [Mycobacterium sp.]